jgi:hypothetical protein
MYVCVCVCVYIYIYINYAVKIALNNLRNSRQSINARGWTAVSFINCGPYFGLLPVEFCCVIMNKRNVYRFHKRSPTSEWVTNQRNCTLSGSDLESQWDKWAWHHCLLLGKMAGGKQSGNCERQKFFFLIFLPRTGHKTVLISTFLWFLLKSKFCLSLSISLSAIRLYSKHLLISKYLQISLEINYKCNFRCLNFTTLALINRSFTYIQTCENYSRFIKVTG